MCHIHSSQSRLRSPLTGPSPGHVHARDCEGIDKRQLPFAQRKDPIGGTGERISLASASPFHVDDCRRLVVRQLNAITFVGDRDRDPERVLRNHRHLVAFHH